jgi:predicted nucleic acid-binding protein
VGFVTRIADALKPVSQLFIDTTPLIYLVERHPAYLPKTRAIFARIDRGDLIGFSSVVTLTEVLTLPFKAGDRQVEQMYRSRLLYSRNFTLLPVSIAIAEKAAQLRAKYNLRTPDALQIAAALDAQCQGFLTNDKGLVRVTELTVLLIDQLEL